MPSCPLYLTFGDVMTSSPPRRSESTLNAFLGDTLNGTCFRHSSLTAHVECTGMLRNPRKQPDMIIDCGPLRPQIVVENKYDSVAASVVDDQTRRRLQHRFRDGTPVSLAIAIRSPSVLGDPRQISQADLAASVQSSTAFRWALWYDGNNQAVRFPEAGWMEGPMSSFAGFVLNVASEHLDVERLASRAQQAIEESSHLIDHRPRPAGDNTRHQMAAALSVQADKQSTRLALSIVYNAFLFQYAVAVHHAEIRTPTRMVADNDLTPSGVCDEWDAILAINYWPIFSISKSLVESIDDTAIAGAVLRNLQKSTERSVATYQGAAQGAVSQVFGKLISDRKFLAAFYTTPAAAAYLSELVVSRLGRRINWADSGQVTELRVADFACGTGALLSAVYRRIGDRVTLTGADAAALHADMMQDVFIGLDVLPSAVHLTASALSSEFPQTDYRDGRTYVMPYGMVTEPQTPHKVPRLGSLELLTSSSAAALFGGGGVQVGGVASVEDLSVDVPDHSCDVVLMNPPFTSNTSDVRKTSTEEGSADPAPALAGLGNDEDTQRAMQKRLDSLAGRIARRGARAASPWTPAGNGNAGIASYFIDLAHMKLKRGGVLGLVLPKTFINGAAWQKARSLIAAHYTDISISAIAEASADARSFSADTGMAEIVLVARKLRQGERPNKRNLLVVSLADQPASTGVLHSLEAARAVTQITSTAAARLRAGGQTLGTTLSDHFTEHGPTVPTDAANVDVATFAARLAAGKLDLPRALTETIAVTELRKLGDCGPVARDIGHAQTKVRRDPRRGAFTISELKDRLKHAQASYPVLWGHDHTLERSLVVLPDTFGRLRVGKPKADALRVWNGWSAKTRDIAGATRLHFSVDFQLSSQPLAACLTPRPCLGGRGWPSFSVTRGNGERKREKTLAVWANTTMGLVLWWVTGTRQQAGRATISVTRLPRLPVVDVRELTVDQLTQAAQLFDEIVTRCPTHGQQATAGAKATPQTGLLPANEAYRDDLRQHMDTEMLRILLAPDADAGSFAESHKALLDGFDTLRLQWCAEPSVHGGKATRP